VDIPDSICFVIKPLAEIKRCARDGQPLLTPAWRQHFRLIWVAMHNKRTVRKVLTTTARLSTVTMDDNKHTVRKHLNTARLAAVTMEDIELSDLNAICDRLDARDTKALATLKRVFLADGRLPPLSHWQKRA
jgi:hypothetical protein